MAVPDVAIIGGGIVGTAAAALLAEAGASVALFERAEIAAAASGRNSGVVQHPIEPVLGALYEETLGHYRALQEEVGGTFRLPDEPAGLLLVSEDGEHARRHATALLASHPELDPAYLEGDALREVEPALADGLAACRLAVGYPVPPAAATRAFAEVAARRGARIATGAAAVPWIEDGRGRGVRVDGRTIAAGALLVAAGPWSAGLLDPAGHWRPIRPLWGVVYETRLDPPARHVLEEAEIEAVEQPPTPGDGGEPAVDRDREPLSFTLVTARGVATVGSTFLEDEPDPREFVPHLRLRAARFVPRVAGAPIGRIRACGRPMSLDRRPLVGAVPGLDRVFLAAGHGPWGITTGPASARIVAELLLGRPVAIPPELDAGRFGSPLGQAGRPA